MVKSTAVLLCIILAARPAAGQTARIIKGVVTDTAGAPLSGVLVRDARGGAGALTGGTGVFALRAQNAAKQIVATHLGFHEDTVLVADTGLVTIRLRASTLSLAPLVVSLERNQKAASERVIRDLDIQLRPRESAQELLRLTPGLVIAQHAGGGKAEQIFLRGFDADHGTDVAISVEGLPVNMVSHAQRSRRPGLSHCRSMQRPDDETA